MNLIIALYSTQCKQNLRLLSENRDYSPLSDMSVKNFLYKIILVSKVQLLWESIENNFIQKSMETKF